MNGKPLTSGDVGKYVTGYFEGTLKIHISITDIRKITERSFFLACKNGNVSAEDFSSVLNCEGHSKRTSEKYYLQHDRTVDAGNAMRARDGLQDFFLNHDVRKHDLAKSDAPQTVVAPTQPLDDNAFNIGCLFALKVELII